jgi:phage gp36-like protein
MSYTTRAAVEFRRGTIPLTVLADADQDGAEDPDRIDFAISEVDALIDAALAGRWPAVIGNATAVLGMIAVDLVIGRLAVGLARSEEIIAAEAAAEARLKAIRDGLLDPDPQPVATATNTQASCWAEFPIMTRAALGRVL